MEVVTIMGIVYLATKIGSALGGVVGITKGVAWFNNKKAKSSKREGVVRAFEHETEKL